MTPVSLDQVTVLLAVVDCGSFSAAARKLGRAQSAVTYAVQKLEEHLGVRLFDRTAYRPVLSEPGRALLPRARRMVEDAEGLLAHARGMARGLEAELTLVADAMFPLACLLAALRAFGEQFPELPTRLYVETLGGTAALVQDGTCTLGLLPEFFCDPAALRLLPLLEFAMVPVAAPCHPLAAAGEPLTVDSLRGHLQLVLTDRSAATAGRDFGVFALRTWRLADLGVKHAMLLAGLGWGAMPLHMVADDIAQGRLVRVRPVDEPVPVLRMCLAHRRDARLGPAARWMMTHLLAGAA